jgi:hypothetical protein
MTTFLRMTNPWESHHPSCDIFHVVLLFMLGMSTEISNCTTVLYPNESMIKMYKTSLMMVLVMMKTRRNDVGSMIVPMAVRFVSK